MKYLSLDFESSIGSTVHGPTFRDLNNDIYTVIAATSPNLVHIEHEKGGFNRQLPAKAVEMLNNAEVIVGVNLSFDLCYIWKTPEIKNYMLRGGKVWDCSLVEYLLTGQQHAFASLAELQLKYLGQKEKPSRISSLYKKGIGADKIVQAKDRCPRIWKLYNYYCQTDGSTPLLIFKAQLQRAQKEWMVNIIELYNDYLLSIINMTVTGIQVDVNETEKTLQAFTIKHLEYLEQAQIILKKVWTNPKLPVFNVNSPDHKSAVLFGGDIKVDGIEPDGFYKNGNPKTKRVTQMIHVDGFGISPSLSTPGKKDGLYSTSDDIMQKIAEETTNYEIKEYCKLQKMAMMYKKAAKTYCKAFIDLNVDGRIHPTFNNTLTSTGRLSCSAPNLQNVSKRNEFGKILHSLFTAPDGWVCCQVDFAQLEIWVLAWLSNDQLLRKHLLEGTDLHIMRLQYYNQDKTYEELYKLCKIDGDEYWNKQRTFAKTVSYQMAYGAQPKKVAESTGLDLEIVETIFKKESETYVGAALLSESVRESILASADVSRECDIPATQRKGSLNRFINGVEMLPIFDNAGNISYTKSDVRQVGFWKSPTGKKYHFLDSGRRFKNSVKRNFSFTQPKNFPMQGSASDIQAATSVALLKALLSKSDKIQMINEVHDSKWFYIREDVVPQCALWLKNTIENVPKILKERFNIDIPFKFPVDIEIGPSFGNMSKYEFNNQEETSCKK